MMDERKCGRKNWYCRRGWNHWLNKCDAYDFGRECKDSNSDPKYSITTEIELCWTDFDCRAGYKAWLDQCEAGLGGGSDDDLASPEAPVTEDPGTQPETPVVDGTSTRT